MKITDEIKNYIYEKCAPFTMLSRERIYANIDSVTHIVDNNILGDIIEIGVWKGGSVLSMILALEALEATRNIKLYDTFSGMTEPTTEDYQINDGVSADILKNDNLIKAECGIEEVKNNIFSNIKNIHNIEFIQGDICKTEIFPEQISILRLDTDWYESTKYELEKFYPIVSNSGIIIIDDYGHWAGSKLAVDEFIKDKNIELNKIDYTGVLFKKNERI
jgi:hypothetical protein